MNKKIKPFLNMTGHYYRRAWIFDHHAYIELHEAPPQKINKLLNHLKKNLKPQSYSWIKISPLSRRLIIEVRSKRYSLDYFVKEVETLEKKLGFKNKFSSKLPDHPGDREPLLLKKTELTAGFFSFLLALTLRYSPLKPRPIDIDLHAIASYLEHVPRLRDALNHYLGKEAAELALILSNAFYQALMQGPFSPLAGMVQRFSQLKALQTRKTIWAKREKKLLTYLNNSEFISSDHSTRPVSLPPGPVEKYADQGWHATLGAFGMALANTHQFDIAAAALFGGLPKPAFAGKDLFLSYLVQTLAARQILPLDLEALHKLDRVDTFIFQADLLQSGEYCLGEIHALDKKYQDRIFQKTNELFDAEQIHKRHKKGNWELRPLKQIKTPIKPAVRKIIRRLEAKGIDSLCLVYKKNPVALVEVCSSAQSHFEDVIEICKKNHLELITTSPEPSRMAGWAIKKNIKQKSDLTKAIRKLQMEGHVVCLIAFSDHLSHLAADVGIGFRRSPTDSSPWKSSLLCHETLEDLPFLVEICLRAREISIQSVKLSLVGVGLSALHTTEGLKTKTTNKVRKDMLLATSLTLANGLRAGIELAHIKIPAKKNPIPWHALEIDTVLKHLKTTPRGLSSAESQKRQQQKTSAFFETFDSLKRAITTEIKSPLTPFLLAGAGLSAILGSTTDASLIASVFGLNGFMGGWQRFRAHQSVSKLSRQKNYLVHVIRDGRSVLCETQVLVPGDIIHLQAGEVVPADCRILKAHYLEVDESALTGESLPVSKKESPSYAPVLAERTSMIYEGTNIAAGEVRGIVVATGEQTESKRGVVGKNIEAPASGVETRLESITNMTIPISLLSGGVLASTNLIKGQSFSQVLNLGVSLAIAAIPEGLPLLATMAQLSAAQRLAARGILVTNTRSIEALGRMNIFCADKTGTLTEGTMKLKFLSNGTLKEDIEQLSDQTKPVLIAALRASPKFSPEKKPAHLTDQSLLEESHRIQMSQNHWERIKELPFEASRGYHAVLGKTPLGLLLSVKGAPEVLIPRLKNISSTLKKKLNHESHQLAKQGLRVLAVTENPYLKNQSLKDQYIKDLTFRGFLAFSDPVRPRAFEAVKSLHRAGVEIIMMTGDHPSTAERIARELGLINGRRVITGPEIDKMSDSALRKILPHVSVIARVSPAHKVRMVQTFQKMGKTVAMTGDGANDAAAIKLADVGIAISAQRSAAAQKAADLIVTDARIDTLVDAIAEGRALWGSVKEAIAILVGGNLAEIGFTLFSGFISQKTPLTSRQLLLMNLLTDVAPSMAIATRPPMPASLEAKLIQGPETALGKALNEDIAWRAISATLGSSLAWFISRMTGSLVRANTVGMVSIVGSQMGQTFLASRKDPTVIATSLGSLATLLTIVQTPGLSHFFHCRPLGPFDMATALFSSGLATVFSRLGPRLTPSMIQFSQKTGTYPWFKEKFSSLSAISPRSL